MANTIVAVEYTSNAGNHYVTGVNDEVYSQDGATPGLSLLGGSAATPAEGLDPLPRQMKPRRVVATNPAGKDREIICLTADAELYAIGAEISLEDSDGAATTYTVTKLKAEEFRRRKKQPA
jgi:hypothetical protein